jgi:hypothetical protein
VREVPPCLTGEALSSTLVPELCPDRLGDDVQVQPEQLPCRQVLKGVPVGSVERQVRARSGSLGGLYGPDEPRGLTVLRQKAGKPHHFRHIARRKHSMFVVASAALYIRVHSSHHTERNEKIAMVGPTTATVERRQQDPVPIWT